MPRHARESRVGGDHTILVAREHRAVLVRTVVAAVVEYLHVHAAVHRRLQQRREARQTELVRGDADAPRVVDGAGHEALDRLHHAARQPRPARIVRLALVWWRAKAMRVFLRRGGAAIEVHRVSHIRFRLSDDLDRRLARRHQRLGRARERHHAIRVAMIRLGREVAPREALDRMLARGVAGVGGESGIGGRERLLAAQPVGLFFLVIRAVDREAEQPAAQRLRQVDAEQHHMRAGDGADGEIVGGDAVSHGGSRGTARASSCGRTSPRG